jgi:hypothetical protein
VTRDNVTGEEQQFDGDYVVCTASLGVLKAGELNFQPPLPAWKTSAIQSLGFGLLNKLILEFPTSFWKTKNDHDMFGYVTPGTSADRGKFYIFWNLERSTGRPILAALCAGDAAYSMEDCSEASPIRRSGRRIDTRAAATPMSRRATMARSMISSRKPLVRRSTSLVRHAVAIIRPPYPVRTSVVCVPRVSCSRTSSHGIVRRRHRKCYASWRNSRRATCDRRRISTRQRSHNRPRKSCIDRVPVPARAN